MNKEKYIEIAKEKINNPNSRNIVIKQIERYYEALENYTPLASSYKVGDKVYLSKGTLLHGTYKNIEGLNEIVNNGLVSSMFVDGRLSKYIASVCVWNLKKDYYLKDYINFYSGGTIEYKDLDGVVIKTAVIPYDEMDKIIDTIDTSICFRWFMEQTKEARFMPSLVQDKVQIGIIFNGNNLYIKELLNGDVLNLNLINDNDVKEFINPDYYEKFIKQRKNKDDFFTDRESAIIFGIPSCFIEGILVGRKYEKDEVVLRKIKELLPNAYICNLDGVVIRSWEDANGSRENW